VLRVLVDATAVPGNRGGVGRYLDGLLPALAARADLAVIVASQARDADLFGSYGVQVEPVPAALASRPARLIWEQVGLPRLAAQVQADVLHCPHYTMPLRPGLPVVSTLHDATFFSDPQLHTAGKARFFRAATRLAIARADALIVPSAATRDELSRLVSRDARFAVVAHHGVDAGVFAPPSPAALDRLRLEIGLGGSPFIAFLGTIEPRKNVGALIEGWQQAVTGRTEPPVLVLAGGPGWDDTIDDLIAEVPEPLRVIRPGYLPLPLLPALLGGAELVCYPALGEGFGLPVLEAMACGAVTVTTDRLALAEVGGDAVEYCPVDAAGIGRVLKRLLDDPERCAQLRRLGPARAAGFSWDSSAAQHVAAYRRAAETTPTQSAQLAASDETAMRPGVTVVAVTYQSGVTLDTMVDSLAAASTEPVGLVLADNGSTDGSPQRAAERDGVTLLKTGANLGFGGGANAGIAMADTEWVLICNPDIVFAPGCIDELLAATTRWPRGATFGPLIRTPDGEIYPSARALPSLSRGIGHALLGWCWPSNPWTASYRAERGAPRESSVGWLSGSCLLARRAALQSVGGFDPAFFMYFEDVELAYQLSQRGWLNVYVPEAEITHLGGASTRLLRAEMTAAHHDSAYRYLARRYNGSAWLGVRALVWLGLKARLGLARFVPAVSEGARPARRVRDADN
jgi:GT2 family glycosyltransferase/glycosyltransferase involved in cell wall biosynthesis